MYVQLDPTCTNKRLTFSKHLNEKVPFLLVDTIDKHKMRKTQIAFEFWAGEKKILKSRKQDVDSLDIKAKLTIKVVSIGCLQQRQTLTN